MALDFASFKVNLIARIAAARALNILCVLLLRLYKPSTISLKIYLTDMTLKQSFRLSYFNLVI